MNSEDKTQTIISRKSIFTIPNLISMFRLALVPLIIIFYTKEQFTYALAVIIISAVSDVVDGKIARRFNMVTDFGKVFDPIADKITQAAMMYCLLTRFPHMMLLLIFLIVKELSTGITSIIVLRNVDCVMSADWQGKLATAVIYSTIILHIIFGTMPVVVSDALIVLCSLVMAIAYVHYFKRNIRCIRSGQSEE